MTIIVHDFSGSPVSGFFHSSHRPAIVRADAIQILESINELFDTFELILNFERKLREADPPKLLRTVRDKLKGIALSIAIDLERFAQDWDIAVDGLRRGSKEFVVKAIINSPPQLEYASAELERISKQLSS